MSPLRGLALNRRSESAGYRRTVLTGTLTDARRDGHQIEEFCRIRDRVRREAGMKMFEHLAISAPAAECEVSRAHKYVAFAFS